jgi:hypothetical protein
MPRIHKLSLAATLAAVALAVVPIGEVAQAAGAPVSALDATPTPTPTPTGIVSPVTGRIAVVEDFVSSPAVPDYDHPYLTVSGRLRIYDPATSSYAAHSGGTAFVLPNQWYSGHEARVATDGTFSVTFRVEGMVPAQPWTAKLYWTPDAETVTAFGSAFGSGLMKTWPLTGAASSWRVLVDQTDVTVKEPGSVRLTGAVQRRVNDVWQNEPNITVYGAPGYATTNATGNFALTTTPTYDGTISVTLEGIRLLFVRIDENPSARVRVDVVPASKLSWTHRTVSADRSVLVRGRLSYTRYNAPDAQRTIYLQRSVNGKTDWSTQGFVQTYDELYQFEDNVRVKNVSGYFRLLYKGGTAVQGSTSPVYQLTRKETRVAKLSITPAKIKKGDLVTFSGIVQKRTSAGSYVNLGKRVKVDVTYRSSLSDARSVVTRHWTTSSGAFSFKKRISSAGYWSVQWRSTTASLVNAYGPDRRIRFV